MYSLYTTDYQQYLDKATAEGVVDTQWSNVAIAGASGTGKTAFLNLLLLNDPVLVHDSTPILQTMDVCIMDTTAAVEETSSESSDNEDEVPAVKEMSQHTILTDSDHLWKVARKDHLVHQLAEAVHSLSEGVAVIPDTTRPYSCPKDTPSHHTPITPITTTSIRAQPVASLGNTEARNKLTAIQQILKLLPQIKQGTTVDLAHWIHLLDTGGQAHFIDIAPGLFRYNSVNIILHKLDEKLDDLANFFYSIDGEVVGREKRKITNAELLRSLLTSRMGVKPPNLEGLAGVDIRGEANLVVLGTHYDKYKEKLKKGEISETLCEKNEKIHDEFKDLNHHVIEYKGPEKKVKNKKTSNTKASQLIFPVNSLSRKKHELKIAKMIRKLASRCYIRAKIPIRWFLIQMEINELKSSNKHQDVVSVSKIVNIGRCLEMSKQEVLASLRYFHDLTVCLYFPDVLPDIIFLSPNLLFKKLTQLSSVTLRGDDSFFPHGIADPLRQRGIFTRAIFDCFPKDGFEQDLFTIDDFLKLMEHLLVFCRLPDGVSYYMPSVLESIDNPIEDLTEEFFNVEPLCLSWQNESVPVGVFPSLTQYLLGPTCNVFEANTRAVNYRNLVHLRYTATLDKVVLFETPQFIGIAHTAPPKESSVILSSVYNGINHIVRACNMKECHPTHGYLCRIEGCPNPSKPHLCRITADNNTLVCSIDYDKRMSIDKICHQPWKGIITSLLRL